MPYPTGEAAPGELTTERFPSGLATAPFEWHYLTETYEMEMLAGFVGVRQDPETLSLRPEIGWAISEPARREVIRAARIAKRQQVAAIASDRAVERARAWKTKALCPQCGTWVYEYSDQTPRHCGRTLSEVTARATP